MRILNRRQPQPRPPYLEQDAYEQENSWNDESDESTEVGGWSTGARANTTILIRWGLTALLVSGPVLGLLALSSTPEGSRPTPAPVAPAPTGGQGAAGFAQLFVAAFLGAGEGDEDELAAYYPPAAQMRLEGAGRQLGETVTARLRQTSPGVWSVTIATHFERAAAKDSARAKKTEDRVRYFQVPIAAAPTAGGAIGYVAVALPAEVAAPARIEAPELVYGPGQPVSPSDSRGETVSAFLSAYLAGRGELDRYLAPGMRMSPIRPAPYRSVVVDQLAVEGENSEEATATVPADGTRQRLLVTVRAEGDDRRYLPLTYALTIAARAGRWEIAALDGAPTPRR